jgi:predicted metal-dependent hydrolase
LSARPAAEYEGLPLVVKVNPRARRMSLRLCGATRTVRLTLPPRVPWARAAEFLEGQRGWIAARVAASLPPALPFVAGAAVPLGDGVLRLEPGPGRVARREGDRLLVPGDARLFAARVRRWLAAEALRTLEPPTRALALRIGQPVASVVVGDYRSRWGSCARRRGQAGGRIAYSWRLVMAPGFVQRALVAHEVAHLAEPNHGDRFWALATELLGEPHDAARAWLRRHGHGLHGIGAVGG